MDEEQPEESQYSIKINFLAHCAKIMWLLYWLSYEAGESLEIKNQPSLNLWSSFLLTGICAKMGLLLTIWDEIELFV